MFLIRYLFVFGLASLLFSSCATICKVSPIKTVIGNNTITFAVSKIPCKKVEAFKEAVDKTIRAIYSKEFQAKLADHILNGIGKGDHEAAWKNVSASEVVAKMRQQINGTYADTYGGIKGLWVNFFSGNIAYDGTLDGPILFNRIPLKKRGAASISNTIAHEIAHRIGLTHPHSSKRGQFDTASNEPPYVIGDIIEDIVSTMP